MRTQVGIVGAGPAGLLLSHLLHGAGIDSVVLEKYSREHVATRVRAGVLEQRTVDLLDAAGLAGRLHREGLVHHGIELRFDGVGHRIALTDLTGRSITVYGQHEVVKDLIDARLAAGGAVHFEVDDVTVHALDTPSPVIRGTLEGIEHTVQGPPQAVAVTPDGKLAIVGAPTRYDYAAKKELFDFFLQIVDIEASPPKLLGKVFVGDHPNGLAINRAFSR